MANFASTLGVTLSKNNIRNNSQIDKIFNCLADINRHSTNEENVDKRLEAMELEQKILRRKEKKQSIISSS